LGIVAFISLFGFFNQFRFGKFIYTSSTGPVNLLIGANNHATGSFNAKVFEKGNSGYIQNAEHETYIEKDEFWQKQAVNWIKDHPVKWLSLLPFKFGYMFVYDDVAISEFLHFKNCNLSSAVKRIIINKKLNSISPGVTRFEAGTFFLVQILHQIFYMFILYCIVYGIILALKTYKANSYIILMIIFTIIGICITLAAVGIPRYKYPYLIACLPFAGFYLKYRFSNSGRNI